MSTPTDSADFRDARLRFYQSPWPNLVADLLREDSVGDSPLNPQDPTYGQVPIIYFYVRLIQEYPEVAAEFDALANIDDARGALAGQLLSLSSSQRLPDVYSIDIDGSVLDVLWSEYSATGNAAAVQRIASVLDWEDIVRARLHLWLQQTPPRIFGRERYKSTCQLLHRCMFPIDFERGFIDESVDMDLHVAAAFQSGNLKADQLPIELSSDEWLKLGTKSSAIWSLKSQATEDLTISAICQEEAKRPGGAGRLLLAV